MDRESYFQSALSNFIFDFACGGSIRHLAAQGYTSRQIKERLSFPVSYERVREAVTKYFLEEGILLCREPAESGRQERYTYVQDHGKYGRTSFRRVPVPEEKEPGGGAWTEREISCGALAKRLQNQDGAPVGRMYAACDFAGMAAGAGKARGDGSDMEFEGSAALTERQREYLQGIRWSACAAVGQPVYHLLNDRMREIVFRLCEAGIWRGKIYLEETREILVPVAAGADTGDMERKDGFV